MSWHFFNLFIDKEGLYKAQATAEVKSSLCSDLYILSLSLSLSLSLKNIAM